MRQFFCALGLALCVGCATAVVRPYVGEQQNWPIAGGGIVNTRYELPVFTSLPPAPYDIIAEMRIESPFYAQPEEGHLPVLVKKAKAMGANALMFVEGQIFFAANYGSRVTADATGGEPATLTQVNRFNPDSFRPGVTIVAIKWIGEPPAGLPGSGKTAPATPVQPTEPTPAPAAEPAPAPAAEPAPTTTPEPVPAPPEPPKAEQPVPPAESTPATPAAPAAPAEAPKAEEPAPAPAPAPAPVNP